MRLWPFAFVVALAACASAPPRPPPPPLEAEKGEEPGPPDEDPPVPAPSAGGIDTPERTRPPSTATYEQAMAAPEKLEVGDDRVHLTDDQLRGPMRGVITGCGLTPSTRVTIHTAVQNGRAIGVTVEVRFDLPRPATPQKRQTRAAAQRAKMAAQREAKAKKRMGGCVDRVVRALVWPPNSRRDSFTTEF